MYIYTHTYINTKTNGPIAELQKPKTTNMLLHKSLNSVTREQLMYKGKQQNNTVNEI